METKKERTVDFKRFEFSNIARTRCVVEDVREQVADLVGQNLCGMAAHAMAHKIYQSEGPVTLTENEARMLAGLVANVGSVQFIDTLFPLLGLRFEDFAPEPLPEQPLPEPEPMPDPLPVRPLPDPEPVDAGAKTEPEAAVPASSADPVSATAPDDGQIPTGPAAASV